MKLPCQLSIALLVASASARADIYRTGTTQPLAGTHGIILGRGINLSNRNSPGHTLEYGDFNADLTNANFANSELQHAAFYPRATAPLTGANFSHATLNDAVFNESDLTNATLTGAAIRGTTFLRPIGFTAAQLYSTASYKERNLAGVHIQETNLTGWNLAGQNLDGASFSNSNLTNTDFHGASLREASFSGASVVGITFRGSNLSHASLNDANLAGADFTNALITGADFSGSQVTAFTYLIPSFRLALPATLSDSPQLTFSQLYSTASYRDRNLTRVGLNVLDLTGWDFHQQNLASASFSDDTLTGADFTNAVITSADFADSSFAAAQLYSTASYARRNLGAAVFNGKNMMGWNFTGQKLTATGPSPTGLIVSTLGGASPVKNLEHGAAFTSASLQGAFFNDADLANSIFAGANCTNTTFDGANLTGANCSTEGSISGINLIVVLPAPANFTDASFRRANLTMTNFSADTLAGTNFLSANLTGANVSSANLTNAVFTNANLTHTDFTDSDLRGVTGFHPVKSTVTTNTILPDGSIQGLKLNPAETLSIYNNAIPITVKTAATFAATSALTLFLTPDWTSTIHFVPGITPTLGGTLNLDFFSGSFSPSGTTIQLFAWNSPLPPSDTFSNIYKSFNLTYDLSDLYTTGFITITAPALITITPDPIGVTPFEASADTAYISPVPEPASLVTLVMGVILLHRRHGHRHALES